MKIKSNDPIWKDVYSQSKLPASLEGLKEMSTNLWWVWNHEGAKLFGRKQKEILFNYCRTYLFSGQKKYWLIKN